MMMFFFNFLLSSPPKIFHSITKMFQFQVLPQIVPFDFGAEAINSMDMVSAYCTVNKGDTPIEISWKFNNQTLYTNNGVLVSRTSQRISVLSIESVKHRHSGNYTCIAANFAGTVQHTAMLYVNG
jgi:hypothetical protein